MEQDLIDDVTCTVCLDVFSKPRNLFCGHALCSECLEALCVAGRRECPVCRREFTGRAEQFPIAIQLQSIADRVRAAGVPAAAAAVVAVANAVPVPEPMRASSAPMMAAAAAESVAVNADSAMVEHNARRLGFGCRVTVPLEQTYALFASWVGALWLAPPKLATAAVLGPLELRWVPFYLIHCSTMTNFSGTVTIHPVTGSNVHRNVINEEYMQNAFRYSDRRFVFAGVDEGGSRMRRLYDPMAHTDDIVEMDVPHDEPVQSAAAVFAQWVEPRVRALCRDKALEQLRLPFAGVQSANIRSCITVFEVRLCAFVCVSLCNSR